MPGASSSSFEELGWGYARDAWKVYYCGEVIPGASPATFRIPDRR
nr:DKNYY domain-containing protein [Alistipes shahii]